MSDLPIVERIRGVRVETGAHRPFPMDDPELVYFVEKGYLDVFAVELKGDEVTGRRQFVTCVPAGEMAFGGRRTADAKHPGHDFGLLAVPSLDASIVAGERAGVASDSFDLTATIWIDQWVSHLSEFLVRDRPLPRNALLLEADPDVPYPAGSILSAQHLDVIWASATAPMRLAGRHDLVIEPGAPPTPLTQMTWFEIDADAEVSAVYTPTALVTERLWPGFDRFNARVLEFAILREGETQNILQTQRRDAGQARRASISKVLREFGAVLGAADQVAPAESQYRTPLQEAASLVAESCGATLKIPPRPREIARTMVEEVEVLARLSGFRTRWIALKPGWWQRDGPSFLGFTKGSDGQEKPLGVLSDNRGGYRAVDPESGTSYTVDADTAAQVVSRGITFYASLPDEVESGMQALRFSMHSRGEDFRTLAAVGILGGLAALLTPILTGQLLVHIIPRAEVETWFAALGALLVVAFGFAVFEVVHSLALLRIESRIDERLQSAVWSRLLALPAPFFREFTNGDLADRANGISEIRQILTDAAVQSAMGGIFSLFSLALLFFYSWSLALCVCGLLLLLVAACWFFSRGQLRHYQEMFRVQGDLNGLVFQLIGGLAKLRVAHAESYALAHWARRFAEQKRASLGALRWTAGQYVVTGMFQPLALVAIFSFIHYILLNSAESSFSLASFLSFNAAFGQLTGAVISLTTAAATVVNVIPLLDRVRPILDARPETAEEGIDPGDLRGDIEFANVTFRYSDEVPNAITGISFHIQQGDYVAFVGPSGSGKSTIYRLLMGFERPSSGTVFLDGHDLTNLDPRAVRARMGVVLQNVQIVAGSIYENIAGMRPLSAEDAWAAVRAAAFEDDIRAMPMGMRTMLPEGGVGLSTGQRQRLMIARALARRPRLLLFDEATSALDNRSQAVVQRSLKRLGVTRVVIAHRLSSIRDVDRIYVLDAGRIVESGSYDELMENDGIFASLSRRQLVRG